MQLDNSIHNILLQYAADNDIIIQYGKEYGYYCETNTVVVNYRYRERTIGICSFLHELGHAINRDTESIYTMPIHSNRNVKAITGNVLVIEWMAWVTGMRIAQELYIWDSIKTTYYSTWRDCWYEYLTHMNNKEEVKNLWEIYRP